MPRHAAAELFVQAQHPPGTGGRITARGPAASSADDAEGEARSPATLHERGDLVPVDVASDNVGQRPRDAQTLQLCQAPLVHRPLVVLNDLMARSRRGRLHRFVPPHKLDCPYASTIACAGRGHRSQPPYPSAATRTAGLPLAAVRARTPPAAERIPAANRECPARPPAGLRAPHVAETGGADAADSLAGPLQAEHQEQ